MAFGPIGGTISAACQLVAAFFGYQTKKEEIAQSAPLVEGKTAQVDRDEIDRENKVVETALHPAAQKERDAALAEERRLAAE
jgi:hypothetical protein